jgi:hypothetical protein
MVSRTARNFPVVTTDNISARRWPTTELPLEAATQDVIARYNRGNDLLVSAAMALRRLKERVEAGEADGMDWYGFRRLYLEPHLSVRWINQNLSLAPPDATQEEVQENVDIHRATARETARRHRNNVIPEANGSPGISLLREPLVRANPRVLNHAVEELVAEFNALRRNDQDEFLRRIGAARVT